MLNFIKQSNDDLKIVSWARFHNQIKGKDTFKNTIFSKDWEEIFSTIETYQKKHKRIKIITHYNLEHPAFFEELQKLKNKG